MTTINTLFRVMCLLGFVLLAAHTSAAGGITATTVSPPFQLLTNLRPTDSGSIDPSSDEIRLSWAVPGSGGNQTSFSIEMVNSVSGKTVFSVEDQESPSPNFRVPMPAAAALEGLSVYGWRVSVKTTAWPSGSGFSYTCVFTTLWPSKTSSSDAPAPMWVEDGDGFVFFRREVEVEDGESIAAAYAFITANPQTTRGGIQNAKLLASYKLFMDVDGSVDGGEFVGVGPGRVASCGPVCPIQGAGTACSCDAHHFVDTYNVTEKLRRVSSGRKATVSVQTYMSKLYKEGHVPAKVMLDVEVLYWNGSRVSVTSSGFRAFNATKYFNPTCCASAYSFDGYQPHENMDAREEPQGWRMTGFDDSAWTASMGTDGFPVPLVPRPSRNLNVTYGLKPVSVLQYPGSSPGTDFFIDFGREIMGGMDVEVVASTAGVVMDVTMAEALLSRSTDWPRGLKVPMNTGNDYHDEWVTRVGKQRFTQHEYSEFRFARIKLGSTCTSSALGDYTDPVRLACPMSETITDIVFASFGTPTGSCGSSTGWSVNATCNAATSMEVVKAACLGHQQCSVVPSTSVFGGDPCDGTFKFLAVEVSCSGGGSSAPPTLSVGAWQVKYGADYEGTEVEVEAGNASLAETVSRIHSFSRYTQMATALDMYTDSNTRQRDVECAESVRMNGRMQAATGVEYTVSRLSTEYVINQRGWGGPGAAEWPMLTVIGVYEDWMRTGELDMVHEHYATLRNWTGMALINSSTGLWECPPCGGLSRVEHCKVTVSLFNCNGPEVDWPESQRDGFVMRPVNTVVNGFTYAALRKFADMARAVNQTHDAEVAEETASRLVGAANRLLLDGSAYVDGVGTTHEAWHSTVFSMLLGLADPLSESQRASLFATVLEQTVAVDGVVGGVYLGPMALAVMYSNVTDHGHSALRLMTSTGPHSWVAQLRQNATTGMEAWSPEDKPNLTYSHPWGNPLVYIFTEYLLGVKATSPGFATFSVRPQLGSLTRVSLRVPTIRGPVDMDVSQGFDGGEGNGGVGAPSWMVIDVTVPGTAFAEVYLAVGGVDDVCVEVDGVVLSDVEFEMPHKAYAVVGVSSGHHVVRSGRC